MRYKVNDMGETRAHCTWVGFYEELADTLLPFKKDRKTLIEKLQSLYEGIGVKLPKLDSTAVPADIDPYTVYGLFNKGISEANRKKIVAAVADVFGIKAAVPSDFDGIPVLNNLNATFYAFVGDDRRGERDIDNLWRVFEAEIALAADDNEGTRKTFIEAFDATVTQFGLGWKLTMGLYWVRPFDFINLDSRNRWYMGNMALAGNVIADVVPKEKDSPIHDGKRYLAICDTIKSQFDAGVYPFSDFPSLSSAAFVESERVNKEKKAAAGKSLVLKSKYVYWICVLTEVLQEYGGELRIDEVYRIIAQRENVEESELRQGNLLAWARNYLADEGYLERSETAKKNRVWRLTKIGNTIEMTDELASTIIRNKNERDRLRREAQGEGALGDAEVETVHYWLYAPGRGAHMWDEYYEQGVMGIGWDELGDLRDYQSKMEIRSRLQELNDSDSKFFNAVQIAWQFANDVKPGDIIFAKRGMSEILGRGVVEGDYAYDPEVSEEYPNLRCVRWTHKGNWVRDKKFAQKTLTDVTDDTAFVEEVKALFKEADATSEDVLDDMDDDAEEPAVDYPLYDREDFLDEVFVDGSAYDTLVGVLRTKKNVILQGAPGVGKTFVAKRLAYSVMGVKDPERVQMVQFHQSYSYEDFIEGYRPSANGFELEKGAFYTFCKKAADDDENDYFFIIDEINRGNLSKIFGELFMLIENDKRGSKNKLQLLYSREFFHVPSNVYLVGMMNTADRSLAMLDYALRRRFAFFDLKPGFGSDGFIAYRNRLGSAKLNDLLACVVRLNEAIAADETLGDGFCIGHSYFCGMKAEDVTDAKLSAIVEYELIPMLREYWFDEPSKVREWADALRRSIK